MEEILYAPEPGVIETLWAEGEEGFDAGGMEDDGAGGEGGEDLDLGDGPEAGEAGSESAPGTDADAKADARYGPKEFREALKTFESTPEGAKFAKQVRADYYATQQLKTLEPGGLPAIREKYALMESVGGAEGLQTMQERVQEVDATDAALAAGDPKALDSLGPDFDPGLAKLMPSILDRVMKADPEAYSAALLPHLMGGLMSSPLVGDLDRMIDVLQAPHLDEKGKIAAITKLLGNIGQWFKANEDRAGKLKTGAPADKDRTQFEQERSEFQKQQQEAHWNTNIIPHVAQAERTKFDELLRPYANQLRLTPAEKEAALKDFRSKLTAACNADKDYGKQRNLYRNQKNPNPAAVVNFAKAHLANKAKAAFDAVKSERWSSRLKGGKPAAQGGARPGAQGQAARGTGASGAVTTVSVKPRPEEIDYRKTSEADQWKGIYTLKNGKQVKWVKPA